MNTFGFTVTEKDLTPIGSLTIERALDLCFQSLFVFYLESYKQSNPNPTTEESYQLRQKIHDDIVLRMSTLVNQIFPEHSLNNSTNEPEAFLEHLNEKIKKLEELQCR